MLKIRDTIQSIKGIILGLIVVLGVGMASAATYSAPTQAPTGGQPAAPINVGSSAQAKQGGLSVFAFTALQNSYFAQKVGIGTQVANIPASTVSGSAMNLSVNGAVGSDAYCNKAGTVCVTSDQLTNNNNTEVDVTKLVPTGAVMAFSPSIASCPAGWTNFSSANGRYIVGATYNLGQTVGTALINLENREVGKHGHTVADDGHAHTFVSQEFTEDRDMSENDNNRAPEWAPTRPVRNTSRTQAGIVVNQNGQVQGTNAPYIQLLYCVKSEL